MKKLEMIIKSKRNIINNIRNAGVIIVIIVLAAACGSSGSSENKIMLESADSMADTAINPELAKNLDMNTSTPINKRFVKTADVKFEVNQVISATEKIEDLTSESGGYIIYSNLQNRQENYKEIQICRDSILISKQITVYNNLQLKVPNEKLDSFVRKLNQLVTFLDYRIIKLDEVTLEYLANSNKAKRLQAYEQRQMKHIDSKDARLKDATYAEDNLLDRQNEADNIKLSSMKLNDDIKYCTITMEIYQKPLITRNVISDFQYISNQKQNFFKRTSDSIVKGWWLLEEIIVFLINLWGIALLAVFLVFSFKYIRRLYRKI